MFLIRIGGEADIVCDCFMIIMKQSQAISMTMMVALTGMRDIVSEAKPCLVSNNFGR